MKRNILFLLLIAISFMQLSSQGFLRRNGKAIINDNGEVLLRGIGIGGWMLQEPYMFGISATNQSDIRKKIEALMGKANTDTFYNVWLTNFVQKSDIDSIAKWGFNSIRLVMHYNLFTLPIEQEPLPGKQTWLNKGFDLVDSVLNWCKANKIYVILDLHAAPGGQGKDAAISDYDASKPSLWESEANKIKTIALWQKLAEKYKDEEWIGAYDLINEPNWDFENSGNQNGCNCTKNIPLLNLYKAIIDSIRKVDTNHMVIVEGNCWGNNYNGMSEIFNYDANLAVSFHKYWSYNDIASIQGILNIRNTYNVPIWCGESGENSNVWYTQAISLFEKNNIGWSWWTLKKVDSRSGTFSIEPNSEYKVLTNYWKNGGTKPDTAFTKNALMKLADQLKTEKCKPNYSVLDAMFRQVQTTQTKAYKQHNIPGTIFATDYDFGRNGYAYYDLDTANYNVSTGTYTTWNQGYAYRNDGVDIEGCSDNELTNGFNVGWSNAGEWLKYTVDIKQAGGYKLCVRHAGTGNAQIMLLVNDVDVTGILFIPPTGGWQTWKTDTFANILLDTGKHSIKIKILQAGANFNYFKFLYDKPSSSVPFKVLSAETSIDGISVYVSVNKPFIDNVTLNSSDWILKVDNNDIQINEITRSESKQLKFSLNEKILYGQNVTISYKGTTVQSSDSSFLETCENLKVLNNLPKMYYLPAKIEAEDYYQQVGLVAEKCDEGGQNMGYTNAGDYLDYLIIVKNPGKYSFQIRIASTNSNGKLELQLFDNLQQKTVIGTVNIPSTGGWQTWKTISTEVTLPEGFYTLRLYIKSPEFNVNWFSFSESTSVSLKDENIHLRIFPNPCNQYFTLQLPENFSYSSIRIYDIKGSSFTPFILSRSNNAVVCDVTKLKDGIYLLELLDSEMRLAVTRFKVMR